MEAVTKPSRFYADDFRTARAEFRRNRRRVRTYKELLARQFTEEMLMNETTEPSPSTKLAPLTAGQIDDIVYAARNSKQKHYWTWSVEQLLADPIHRMHWLLDIACATQAITHDQSAKFRAMLDEAEKTAPKAREAFFQIERSIRERHAAGELHLF